MPKIEEADVLEMLKREMPYYERDDKDDYFYLARKDDLERIAHLVVFMIRQK
jgi:hypothetical protein